VSRRDDQLVDDAAEVAALLEQPDDAEDAQLVDELGDVPDDQSTLAVVFDTVERRITGWAPGVVACVSCGALEVIR